ncbi:16239_t:CDS:2, partial [Cetraspora pellucida]
MGKQPHHLSEFIIVLDEKANKSNKFCVCQECVIGSSYEDAYNNRFANTQELVRRHLKNCIYFKQKYSKSEQAEILAKSDKVVSTTNNSFQESIDDNSATESEVSSQASLYKSYISFVTPNSTRWNSHYLCFASIIRSCAALKNLATRIEEENDNNLKGFPRSILFNISDNEWWKNLIQLKSFCKGIAVELHLVAVHIFSICITTASVEWLFSAMGWYHSDRRNQLQ